MSWLNHGYSAPNILRRRPCTGHGILVHNICHIQRETTVDLPFSRLLQAFLQNRLMEPAHIVAGPIRERGMILQRNEYRHGSRLRVFHEVKGAPLLLPRR